MVKTKEMLVDFKKTLKNIYGSSVEIIKNTKLPGVYLFLKDQLHNQEEGTAEFLLSGNK